MRLLQCNGTWAALSFTSRVYSCLFQTIPSRQNSQSSLYVLNLAQPHGNMVYTLVCDQTNGCISTVQKGDDSCYHGRTTVMRSQVEARLTRWERPEIGIACCKNDGEIVKSNRCSVMNLLQSHAFSGVALYRRILQVCNIIGPATLLTRCLPCWASSTPFPSTLWQLVPQAQVHICRPHETLCFPRVTCLDKRNRK